MPLTVGSRLGPYSVTAKIGEGEMGRCIVLVTRNSTATWL